MSFLCYSNSTHEQYNCIYLDLTLKKITNQSPWEQYKHNWWMFRPWYHEYVKLEWNHILYLACNEAQAGNLLIQPFWKRKGLSIKLDCVALGLLYGHISAVWQYIKTVGLNFLFRHLSFNHLIPPWRKHYAIIMLPVNSTVKHAESVQYKI